eukprot:COSAG01_NODE_35531_length_530_cov_1.661253_1_plen_86_part_10
MGRKSCQVQNKKVMRFFREAGPGGGPSAGCLGAAARWGLRRPFRQARPCAAGMAISAREHVNSNTAQLNGALFSPCCRPLPLLFCA